MVLVLMLVLFISGGGVAINELVLVGLAERCEMGLEQEGLREQVREPQLHSVPTEFVIDFFKLFRKCATSG